MTKKAETWQENWYGMPGDIKQLLRLVTNVPSYRNDGKYDYTTREADRAEWMKAKSEFKAKVARRLKEVEQRYLWLYRRNKITKDLMDKVVFYLERAMDMYLDAAKLASIRYEHAKLLFEFKGFAHQISRNTTKKRNGTTGVSKECLDFLPKAYIKELQVNCQKLKDVADTVLKRLFPHSIYLKDVGVLDNVPARISRLRHIYKLL